MIKLSQRFFVFISYQMSIIFTSMSIGIIDIPFKKLVGHLSSLKPEELVYPGLKNSSIITEIKLGSSPQTLTMKIELINYSFYIYDQFNSLSSQKFLISSFLKSYSPIFDQSLSSTFVKLGEIKEYNHQTLSFRKRLLASDYLIICNKKFKIKFILSNDFVDYFSGGIGLRINDTIIDGISEYNFLKQLKENNLINNYYFTFKFKDNISGNLIIGDLPDKYDKNYHSKDFRDTYIETKRGADSIWNIKLDKIYASGVIDSKDRTEFKQSIGYFRSSLGVILGTKSFRKDLYNSFMKEEIINGNCFEVKSIYYYTYYCKKNVDTRKVKSLFFYNRDLNYTFEFTSNDLFYRDNITGNQYYLVIFDEEEYQWLLGVPFLRKYQIVFNQDKKKVGIYIKNNENENNYLKNTKKNNLYILLISILVFLVIILGILLFIILKVLTRKRKKKTFELDEDYDYKINNF